MRVTLLPDKKHRLETKIKRRTLNPRWNETFYFEGEPELTPIKIPLENLLLQWQVLQNFLLVTRDSVKLML